jgi:hypothetical protein
MLPQKTNKVADSSVYIEKTIQVETVKHWVNNGQVKQKECEPTAGAPPMFARDDYRVIKDIIILICKQNI